MTLREIMSCNVIKVSEEEPVAVAARMLDRYNVGVLPVCSADGRLTGVVTDRDLVTRCMAPGKESAKTKVQDVMTANVVTAAPETEVCAAARMMARSQIRRLPVVANGKLQGMVSLGDLAQHAESCMEAGDALSDISASLSRRD